ncbi:hypothetical protein VNO78_15063 [Psophocarpus tetragonolobus]|uniref:Uncharacterized protein n=1 Tax=Psophocarpus tetragonolobus TaxID=3891 RepID=A0AAN9SFA6_PSOTE
MYVIHRYFTILIRQCTFQLILINVIKCCTRNMHANEKNIISVINKGQSISYDATSMELCVVREFVSKNKR